LFQIIINQVGLSLGETEAINSLFSDYYITENTINNDFEFASILEIEFLKDKSIEFFDFISIDKWSILIEIIKNIKKRRGRKGLKLKIVIIDIEKLDYKNNNNDDDNGKENEDDNQEIIFRETSFLLNHKNDLDFIKGLERIEITIENLNEIYEFQKLKEEEKETDNNKINEKNIKNRTDGNIESSIIFTFNEINRKWIRFTDKSTSTSSPIKKSK
jgi:hypothetical protein